MLTYFRIGLSDTATKHLHRLFGLLGGVKTDDGWQPKTPEELIARLLTDILLEDATEHGEFPTFVNGGKSLH